jgi:hypothetical protein
MSTIVLWLFLQSGQVAVIPGFTSPQNCQAVGGWYQSEAQRGNSDLHFKCGPGPDVSPLQQMQSVLPRAFQPYR